MGAFAAGLSKAGARVSNRWCALACAAATLFCIVIATFERGEDPSVAADLTLSEAVFAWAVPLVSYYAVGRGAVRGRTDRAIESLARFGYDRRATFGGFVAGVGLRASGISAIVAVLAVLAAHGRMDGTALSDAFTSGWIAALGALAYAALFSLGSLFGRGGQGRAVLLGADWVLGTISSGISLPWPRAHLQSLIGGPPVNDLSGAASTVFLYVITALCLFSGMARTPR